MARFLRFVLVGLLAVLLLGGAGWLTARWWLPGLAGFLITEDPLRPADLIVVLSGSPEARARFGAELYHEGYAPRILCASSLLVPDLKIIGKRMTHAELSAAVLRKEGVPDRDILIINTSTSTLEELRVLRELMEQAGWKRAILVSSPYHLRRIRWTWEHVAGDTDLVAILRATPHSKFHRDAWWRHEADLLAVQNEYAKLIYYRLLLFRGFKIDDSDARERMGLGSAEKKHRGEDAAMPVPE